MTEIKMVYKKYTALFGGMGFHNSEAGMYSLIEPEYFNRVVSKCYREVSPGFMRTWGGFAEWSYEAMDEFYEYYSKMQKITDTTIYIVPGRGISRETPELRRKWASDVADRIDYLYNQKGMKHIRYYCMSNELSLDGWGAMTHRLDVFKEYQEYLWREFQKRDLPVGLLATDAAHYKNWNTIEWAMRNISYMTDAYCGHLYLGGYFDCEDLGLYKWAYNIFKEFSEQSKAQEKRFILGEYGWGGVNSERTVGSTVDRARYIYTEKESYSMLSLAEVTLAALNAGVYTMSFWTFMDYPDPQSKVYHNKGEFAKKWSNNMKYLGWGTDCRYNKCGILHWNRPEDPAYDGYWCLGLMCRYLRQDSRLLGIECDDDMLRMGAVMNNDGTVSLCIVNRHKEDIDIKLTADFGIDRDFRVYRYDSDNVPRNKFADLQDYDCKSQYDSQKGATVKLHPNSVTVITTDYVERVPCVVEGLELSENKLSWKEVSDEEHCYYRVFKNGQQIASTVDTVLRLEEVLPDDEFYVCSVDIYGNCVKPNM